MKQKIILLTGLAIVAASFTACSNDNDRISEDLVTPNVTELGIPHPFMRMESYDMEKPDEKTTYNYQYSSDNQVYSFEGNGWTMVIYPFSFSFKNGTSLANFKINEKGCATYFECLRKGILCEEYHITYDANNRLSSVKTIDHVLSHTLEKHYIRKEDGRIDRIVSYADGKAEAQTIYTYGTPATSNKSGIFLTSVSSYDFLPAMGLLGCPSPCLPKESTYYTESAKNEDIVMHTKYTYKTINTLISQIIDETEWKDLKWTTIYQYTYKGLYIHE
ncbi:MAG TPA: hypothetical protein DEQ27_01050 [Prevotella sp.]|nr:hypothetical protein [Prevotella sp.]